MDMRYLHKAQCPTSKQIPEETLIKITTDVLGMTVFDETAFTTQISHIMMSAENMMHFHFYNKTVVDVTWRDRSRSESCMEEMRNAARQKTLQMRNSKWQEQ